MKWLALRFIIVLLTFSVGSTAALMCEAYNVGVRQREEMKRQAADYIAPVPRRPLTTGEVLWKMRKAGCRRAGAMKDEARRTECAE